MDLYHPVEHAILSEYLGEEPLIPVDDVDIHDGAGTNKNWVSLEANDDGEFGDIALENAVARLALEGIQDRLPQWAVVHGDGTFDEGRNNKPKTRRKVALFPRLLFGINWADSAPGISWPETYYYVYLPGYHVYVVTASQDCTDVHGYTDQAIGHFSGDERDTINACGKIIRDWWDKQFRTGMQQPWEQFSRWGSGVVDETAAEEWAWQVWGEHDLDFPPPWFEDMAFERCPSEEEDDDDELDYVEIAPGGKERPSYGVEESEDVHLTGHAPRQSY
jgi:hypothetical protein